MVKVIMNKLSILMVLLFMSCSGIDYKKDNYNIVINPYNDAIEVDLNTRVIKINYGYFQYQDSLHLSKEDESKIIHSFEQNIGNIKGEYSYYSDTLIVMDLVDQFRLKVYRGKNIQSEISIAKEYENKGQSPIGQKYKAARFRDDFLEVLERSREYHKILNISYENSPWIQQLKHGNDKLH